MATEIESFIAQNCPWDRLPINIKKLLGNTKKEYEKQVVEYCIKTQQQYIGNLVQHIVSDQRTYYKELVAHSRSHLMMFPYHLSEFVVRGLRITPFQYYIDIVSDIMTAEKSYDSLPNFTAADCLRLLGIGRNQYIDLMNQCRSTRKLFRRRNNRDLLPSLPKEITIEAWWMVKAGYITEEDIKNVTEKEKVIVDTLIDTGPQRAGSLQKDYVQSLYRKGLVYLDVPIGNSEYLSVPPLEGFVMNRVLGDYLENVMYKIFVSIDEHTTVSELAKVLQIDLALVKAALSLFCRLGFAHLKLNADSYFPEDPSWGLADSLMKMSLTSPTTEDLLLMELEAALTEGGCEEVRGGTPSEDVGRTPTDEGFGVIGGSSIGVQQKRIAFLYDSTLTAFLMMGNLSPGLKNHAVTMFEVGKMLDEGMDSLLAELGKIQRSDSEGEAQRYFEHALTLKTTIGFLRHNPDLVTVEGGTPSDLPSIPPGLDLIRWESLSNLDPATTCRLLNKNYRFLVSMSPLSYEIPQVEGDLPPHFGPHIPEINSTWFKLFLYNLAGSGPPSLLLPCGFRLKRIPEVFMQYEKVLVTPWGHDPNVLSLSSIFFTVNDMLTHSAVLIQAYGYYFDVSIQYIPLPLDPKNDVFSKHSAIKTLNKTLNFAHVFGFLKMVSFTPPEGGAEGGEMETTEIKTGVPKSYPSDAGAAQIPQVISFDDMSNIDKLVSEESGGARKKVPPESSVPHPSLEKWLLMECHFGLPLFDANLNDEISRRVVAHKLFAPSSVNSLMAASKIMVEMLESFLIKWEGQRNPYVLAARRQLNNTSSNLPLPTRPLFFTNEKLDFWDGW